MTPDSILHYRIEKKLGEGGMGAVFLATDTKLNRQVAIKLLSSDRATDPESRLRFIHEAKAEAMLSHPNIVTFHEVGETDGQAFIVMEYVEGQSLRDYVQSQRLSVPQILELVIQAGEGLQAAHEKGVIHRDIKPENIMVTPKGHVKITDFGLARWKGATTITKTGTRMGSAFYMSPEQAEGRKLDHRSDIFSLGVVLYELLCKQRPFEGESEAVVLYDILSTKPQPLARYSRNTPAELERIVGKCLAKPTDERYQSVADMNADLKHLCRQLESGTVTNATEEAQARPSIAVLPFVNMSEDRGNEYFSDGLTEELINALVKIPDLHVAARTSCFQFKGRTGDIESIGRQLKVSRILEGSVRKAGNRIRITAQLIDATNGYHLWSETYDRELEDIFAVQDDIAKTVASTLQVTLQPTVPGSQLPQRNEEVFDLILQARFFMRQLSTEGANNALKCYRLAIDKNPNAVDAWAGLSLCYSQQVSTRRLTFEEGMPLARKATDQALKLDPSSVEALVATARLKYSFDHDWSGAEHDFKRALNSEPGNILALSYLADLWGYMGHLENAITTLYKITEQDPLNPQRYSKLSEWLLVAGRFDESAKAIRKALELQTNRENTYYFLGMIHLLQHQYDRALEEMKKEPQWGLRDTGLAMVNHTIGDQESANEALKRLIDESWGQEYQISQVFAYWADLNNAFKWLDSGVAHHEAGMGRAKTDPLFRNLHGDPRWRRFLEKIGLAD